MAFWRTIIVSRGLSHPTQQKFEFKQKLPLLSAALLDGQYCSLITYQGVFSRVEKPSDDVNSSLFLMNKKELT
jgi:hypothetical protein